MNRSLLKTLFTFQDSALTRNGAKYNLGGEKITTAFQTNGRLGLGQASQILPKFPVTPSWRFYESGDALIHGVRHTVYMTSTSGLMPRSHSFDLKAAEGAFQSTEEQSLETMCLLTHF